MGSPRSSQEAAEIEEGNEEQHQYLTFLMAKETFAIGILRVKEIIEFGALTAVPMMPPCVRGVINLRGRVVPVVDLAVRFGRAETEPGRRTCIVIVEVADEGDHRDIGIIVDAVNQVIEILPSEIEPAPAFGANLRGEFIQGMGKVEGRFVIILEIARVLSVDEMAHLGRDHGRSSAGDVSSGHPVQAAA
ncbi:MAG: Positive regulator of CheA protein activity (CheW) [Nitrospira sp.]|nr:MAG: Positive regulator of CheA protein activity (CheW) [Nitrospira sp.]